MGKDAKERPLGDRGSTGGPGFAESGARNWLHSAATVLAFLQKERGLLQPGFKFHPLMPDGALPAGAAGTSTRSSNRPAVTSSNAEAGKTESKLITTASPLGAHTTTVEPTQ